MNLNEQIEKLQEAFKSMEDAMLLINDDYIINDYYDDFTKALTDIENMINDLEDGSKSPVKGTEYCKKAEEYADYYNDDLALLINRDNEIQAQEEAYSQSCEIQNIHF